MLQGCSLPGTSLRWQRTVGLAGPCASNAQPSCAALQAGLRTLGGLKNLKKLGTGSSFVTGAPPLPLPLPCDRLRMSCAQPAQLVTRLLVKD